MILVYAHTRIPGPHTQSALTKANHLSHLPVHAQNADTAQLAGAESAIKPDGAAGRIGGAACGGGWYGGGACDEGMGPG